APRHTRAAPSAPSRVAHPPTRSRSTDPRRRPCSPREEGQPGASAASSRPTQAPARCRPLRAAREYGTPLLASAATLAASPPPLKLTGPLDGSYQRLRRPLPRSRPIRPDDRNPRSRTRRKTMLRSGKRLFPGVVAIALGLTATIGTPAGLGGGN